MKILNKKWRKNNCLRIFISVIAFIMIYCGLTLDIFSVAAKNTTENNTLSYLETLNDSLENSNLDDELKDSIKEIISMIPKYYSIYFKQETIEEIDKILIDLNQEIEQDSFNLSDMERETLTTKIAKAVDNLEYKSSSVPRIFISTEDGNGNTLEKYERDEEGNIDETKKMPYTSGTKIVIVNENGEVEIEDIGGLMVSGKTTAYGRKKPYNIELSEKTELLGMGRYKTWVLLANYFEPTLLRNYLAYEFGRELNLAYTPDQRYVELWLDGVFKGTYTLMEKIDKEVDVKTKNGEFLIETSDTGAETESKYITTGILKQRFELTNPYEPTEEEEKNILDVLDNVEAALVSGDYNKVKEIIDVESFAKYYLLNEYWKSAGESIFFYYKDDKFYAGPIWDFDLSAGNIPYINDKSNQEVEESWTGLSASSIIYISNLLKYENFYNEVNEQYENYKSYMKDIYKTLIDKTVSEYRETFDFNFKPIDEGGAGWDEAFQNDDHIGNYDKNVEYFKEWLENRYNWMEECFSTELKKLVEYEYVGIDISDFEVSMEEIDLTYTGKELKPIITINNGEFVLSQDIDYVVEYQNNINAGQGIIIIEGIGKYFGSITKNFTINKADLEYSSTDYSGIFDGNNHTITINIPSESKITYANSSGVYSLTTAPSYKDIGSYTVNFEITMDNYNTVRGSNKVNIYGIKSIGTGIKLDGSRLKVSDYTLSTKSIFDRFTIYDDASYLHYDKDKKIKSLDAMASGDYLTILINNNKAYEYQVVVLGDVNGDGNITALDYVKVKNHIMNTTKLTDSVYISSADLNQDGNISTLDYVKIKNYVMNRR